MGQKRAVSGEMEKELVKDTEKEKLVRNEKLSSKLSWILRRCFSSALRIGW